MTSYSLNWVQRFQRWEFVRLRGCSHRQFFFQVRVDVLHYIPMTQGVFVKTSWVLLKTPLPAGFFHCSGWFSSWDKFNSPRKSTRRQVVFWQLTNEREPTSLGKTLEIQEWRPKPRSLSRRSNLLFLLVNMLSYMTWPTSYTTTYITRRVSGGRSVGFWDISVSINFNVYLLT